MDTDDYLTQCCRILRDSNTYRPATSYPKEEIKTSAEYTTMPFKEILKSINPKLYKYLLLPTQL